MDIESTVRQFYEQLNARDIDGFGALLADDFTEHEPTPGFPPTKAGVIESFRMLFAAFPDMHMDVQDVVASDDRAAIRVRLTGTQEGEMMGIPPTGKRVDVQLIDITRFGDDGLAREHWGVVDMLAMMQQLGVVRDGPPA